MNRRRMFVAGGVLLVAGILAYAFAGMIRQVLILPMMYFFWRAAQFYHALPQQLLWAALVVVVIYLVGLTFLDLSPGKSDAKGKISRRGQVETLADTLDRRNEGTYFKWQIANLLGEVALDILTYQERLLPGRGLRGRGWAPPPAVDKYLSAGLNTTFADYPGQGRFGRRPPTPNFDIDLDPVLTYLESQLETDEHDDDTA